MDPTKYCRCCYMFVLTSKWEQHTSSQEHRSNMNAVESRENKSQNVQQDEDDSHVIKNLHCPDCGITVPETLWAKHIASDEHFKLVNQYARGNKRKLD